MSRAAIAQRTGISKPTISESAQRLLAQSLVVATNQQTQGHQGRSGLIYDMNAQRGYSLGIALERGRIQARALNFKAEPVWEYSQTIPDDRPATKLTQTLQRILDTSQEQTGLELLCLGFSVADPVDPNTGQVIPLPDSPFPAGHELRFLEAFSRGKDCPVILDNDVNWATLAEQRFGCMQGKNDFLFVYLGPGIGAGLFLSGQLHRGARGLAGEIGYLNSGRDGNLLQMIKRQPGSTWGQSIFESLGQAIANASLLLNPEAIVLGGPLTDSAGLFESLAERIKAYGAQSLLTNQPPLIKKSQMPQEGPLVGVAAYTHRRALESLGVLSASPILT